MDVLNRAERRLVKSEKLTCSCKYGVVRLFNKKGDMVAEKLTHCICQEDEDSVQENAYKSTTKKAEI